MRLGFLFLLCFAQAAQAGCDVAVRLVQAAKERLTHNVVYDGRYYKIAYPGGDVPPNVGVCSDVVIRSYRALGIDLQRLVREDMKKNFHLYPKKWRARRPDPNIDHRRVPNLQTFFARQGARLPQSLHPGAYQPGDLVTWNLRPGGDLPHIGIVTDQKSEKGVPLVIHNIGEGPKLEDILFAYEITGHYRYKGP